MGKHIGMTNKLMKLTGQEKNSELNWTLIALGVVGLVIIAGITAYVIKRKRRQALSITEEAEKEELTI